MRSVALLAAVALMLAPQGAAAAEVVVYRCTAADGSVTLQNGRRCPKGQREQRRVIETPTPRAVPAAPVAPPAPAPPAATPVSASKADAAPAPATRGAPVTGQPRSPAPAVFACRTWDGQRYYGDTDRPAPRCAPLETVGLDRRSETAAQACELRTDACEPVAEAARCAAWGERLRAAEGAARFGDAGAAEAARGELARLRTLLAGTACAR